MKKIICLLIVMGSSCFHSQIQKIDLVKCEKVGRVSQGVYELVNEECSDGFYRFSFRDFNYSRIVVERSFKFKDVENAYNNLFDSIIKGFDNPKENIAFELPEHYVIIKYINSIGIKGISFFVKDKTTGESGSSNYFSKNQIYKLFGKSK